MQPLVARRYTLDGLVVKLQSRELSALLHLLLYTPDTRRVAYVRTFLG